MMLKPTRVSSDLFDYRNKQFTAEISNLGPEFRFGRVYDNAPDEGLTLVSARTGAELVFAIVERQKDAEGDLVAWRLVPVEGASSNKGDFCEIVLFND